MSSLLIISLCGGYQVSFTNYCFIPTPSRSYCALARRWFNGKKSENNLEATLESENSKRKNEVTCRSPDSNYFYILMIKNRGDVGFNVETFEGENYGHTISPYQENCDVLQKRMSEHFWFSEVALFLIQAMHSREAGQRNRASRRLTTTST